MEGENFYLVIGHWLVGQIYRSVERSHSFWSGWL